VAVVAVVLALLVVPHKTFLVAVVVGVALASAQLLEMVAQAVHQYPQLLFFPMVVVVLAVQQAVQVQQVQHSQAVAVVHHQQQRQQAQALTVRQSAVAVAVAVLQTKVLTVAQVAQAETHKSQYGYGDEILNTQHTRPSHQRHRVGRCRAVHP
jgi:uncharacterized membrane protein